MPWFATDPETGIPVADQAAAYQEVKDDLDKALHHRLEAITQDEVLEKERGQSRSPRREGQNAGRSRSRSRRPRTTEPDADADADPGPEAAATEPDADADADPGPEAAAADAGPERRRPRSRSRRPRMVEPYEWPRGQYQIKTFGEVMVSYVVVEPLNMQGSGCTFEVCYSSKGGETLWFHASYLKRAKRHRIQGKFTIFPP